MSQVHTYFETSYISISNEVLCSRIPRSPSDFMGTAGQDYPAAPHCPRHASFTTSLGSEAIKDTETTPCHPKSAAAGNLKKFYARDAADYQRNLAREYGPIVRLSGFLGAPILYVSDSKALHTILIKEEHIFQETPESIANNTVVFGAHSLLSTLGAQHGRQRKLLNPVFSANHMRHMLPLFYTVIHKLRSAIASRVSEGQREIDMLGWMGRVALELVGQGGLGYSFDPLVTDSTDTYGEALKSLVPALSVMMLYRKVAVIAQYVLPAWLRRAVVDAFPSGTEVHKLKNIINTMDSRAREIYNAKKDAFAKGDATVVKQIAEGNDIISILMRANSVADAAERLSEEEVIHQMSLLISAGMDTTSNALSRILHLLAQNPDVQDKLRQELLAAGAADVMTYDDLNHLRFLDSVCRETLRVYPPVTILSRIADKDTVLPLSEPIYGADGTRMDEIPIAKGSEVLLGFLGCNTSTAIWGEDAHEWKPERWLSSLPSAVTDAHIPGVYSNLMTFLGGKRACIGFKFSEMETKVVLAVLISNFTFELSDKPIEWNVAPVWYPTVGKDDKEPRMPLKVGLYKGSWA
ncbi:cytochrome P450 [Daedalea quercina L-15889]|uniref:Cytochrome P450 n=1 Tax=Daedalea quercina L-15889 TaxID=1314783 RepID=A0A165MFQ0_9APHY|nr:cytochrome P450 [Daedalea quercina L-15889]